MEEPGIRVTGEPIRYYDSYKITKLKYKDYGVEKEVPIKAVKLDTQFYKTIANYNEWSQIEEGTYQNYILTGDIDYANAGLNPKKDVTLAKLEGNNHKIFSSDTNLVLSGSIIYQVYDEINDIIFSDLSIDYTGTDTYNGVIDRNNGTIDNCQFNNIEVIAEKANYIGCVGYSSGTIRNIKLDNIFIHGKSYVGGLVGYQTSVTISNIEITNAEVIGTSTNVGGVVGYGNYANNTNVNVKNSTITSNENKVGGLIGYANSCHLNNCYVIDSTIQAKTGYAGGLIGHQNYYNITNSYVQNSDILSEQNYAGGLTGYKNGGYITTSYVKDSNVQGKTSYIGGIIGYLNAGGYISKSSVQNLNIGSQEYSSTSYLGGLVGCVNNGSVYLSYAENSNIYGGSRIGGIAGYLNVGSIYRNYNNTILNGDSKVGGIVGELYNKNLTVNIVQDKYSDKLSTSITSASYIYENIASNREITAKNSVGGLIGCASKLLLYLNSSNQEIKFYYNNLVESKIIGSVESTDIIIGFFEDGNKDNIKNTQVYKYSTINGDYIDSTNIENGVNYVTGTDLQTQSFYTSKLNFNTTNWDFTTLAKGKYPIIKSLSEQTGIDLPTDPEGMLNTNSEIMTMSLNELDEEETIEVQENTELPYVDIYQVSANEINIEFSGETQNVEFSISNNIATNKVIEEQVYTLNYDFKTPLEIIVKNTITGESKTYEIKPEDLIKTIGIQEGTYYYIEENTLKSNKGEEQVKYINLYEDVSGKVTGLTEEGKVVQLSNGNVIESSTTNALEETSKPRYEFTYNGSIIRTYRNYSQIITGEETVTRDKQIYVKQNKMYIIDPKIGMKNGNLVLDSYNGKEYETMLGKDGKLYNLKEEIVLPEGIDNEKIEEITNNIGNEYNEVMIRKADKIYVIDYITGEIKYEEELNSEEEKIGLIEYITDKWNKEILVSEEAGNNYSQTQEVITKLEETSIEEAKGIIAEDNGETEDSGESTDEGETSTNRNYVSSYNSQTGGYDIYSEEEILDTNKEEVETENSKIEQTEGLKQFYYNSAESKKSVNNYGMIFIILIIGAIFVVLRKLNKRN